MFKLSFMYVSLFMRQGWTLSMATQFAFANLFTYYLDIEHSQS